ncbi:helix-turn-helix domain-containing protein [Candidatus Nitrospira bockiana]
MNESGPLLDRLEEAIRTAGANECALLLGHLERMKFLALTKMMSGGGERASVTKLTMQQVAQRLNIPVSCAYELVRQGKLKAGKVGKYIRVTEAQLKEYEASRGL